MKYIELIGNQVGLQGLPEILTSYIRPVIAIMQKIDLFENIGIFKLSPIILKLNH